jgi:hypothetical protein
MVTVLDIPIPVTTECGDGYILYIKSNGFLENDEFAVVLLSRLFLQSNHISLSSFLLTYDVYQEK